MITKWELVPIEQVNNKDYKFYRDLYTPSKTIEIAYQNQDADDLADKYLGSDQFMSKIVDTNKVMVCEFLGNMRSIKKVLIPVA